MKRVDSFPTHSLNGIEYCAGHVLPFGATLSEGAVNFSIFSRNATACTLLLYHSGEEEPFVKIPFRKEFRIGNVFAMQVFDLDIEDVEYAYLMDGPYDPKLGYLFDPTKPLLDPYARSVSGRTRWGKRVVTENTDENSIPKKAPFRGKIIRNDYDWEGDRPLEIPLKDLVIYEAHVRGFTKHASSKVRRPGTYAGLREKIPYLKELGVNCIELLPIFEFDELENPRNYEGMPLYNYWGYSTVCFFAPKAGYSAMGKFGLEADELKALIKKLHANGIEILLDVVFNHTAEGNEDGPVISYKGIDNSTYYLLTPGGGYFNFSGCGNTMNCNNAVVRNYILDCLRYWASEYHIDGFRFDLASILSRDESGRPMANPPLLESLAHDAILGSCKLIAEAWDAGGLYQVGNFPSWGRWAEWNGKYRDTVRRFVKGDAFCAPELYERIAGSPDLYGNRSSEASIDFVTCHDGFTLRDLVSYNEKHNEANGEQNRDGANDNNSWNCGIEGATDDESILDLRFRQMRNMMTLLFTSRGVPMILAGDEFANTQFGNNNAYCQDNEISWLNWDGLPVSISCIRDPQDHNEHHRHGHQHRPTSDEARQTEGRNLKGPGGPEEVPDVRILEHWRFLQNLIAFRKAHPVLREKNFFTDYNGTGYPELSFHGTSPWWLDRKNPTLTFAYMFVEDHARYNTSADCFIYVCVNAHWEWHEYELPIVPKDYGWKMAFDTCGTSFAPGHEEDLGDRHSIWLSPRSMRVLIAVSL